jgi:hypothetical protein
MAIDDQCKNEIIPLKEAKKQIIYDIYSKHNPVLPFDNFNIYRTSGPCTECKYTLSIEDEYYCIRKKDA